MTGVGAAVAILCSSLFAAALLKMLSPSGSTEKVIKLVIGIFVLISIATCFKAIADSLDFSDLSSSFDDTDNSALKDAVDSSVLKTTAEYMTEYVNSLLLQKGIAVSDIKVTVKADENSVINVSDITIYIDIGKATYKTEISNIIEESLGVTPKISIQE